MGKSKSKKGTIAIFLAHLNPLTLSHEKIIQSLLNDYKVYVFPVRFLKNNEEEISAHSSMIRRLTRARVRSITSIWAR